MPNLENFSAKDIKAIIDCLCYLEIGTRENGLDEINGALKDALLDIYQWMENTMASEYLYVEKRDGKHSNNIMDFCDIISFLDDVIKLDKRELSKIVRVVDGSINRKASYH